MFPILILVGLKSAVQRSSRQAVSHQGGYFPLTLRLIVIVGIVHVWSRQRELSVGEMKSPKRFFFSEFIIFKLVEKKNAL